MKLFFKAMAQEKYNILITNRLEKKESIQTLLPEVEIQPRKLVLKPWWLESAFKRIWLPFFLGVFVLLYIPFETTRLTLILSMIGKTESAFVVSYALGALGDLVVPFSLLFIHGLYKVLTELGDTVNSYNDRKIFVCPLEMIPGGSLESHEKLDYDYRNRYFNPLIVKTLQYGFDLAYDKNYQLGSGIISILLFLISGPMKIAGPFGLTQTLYAYWGPAEFRFSD